MINLNNCLVHESKIRYVDFSNLKSENIIVVLDDLTTHEVTGFAALELIWTLKPSVLEGNNSIKWAKNAWAVHNLVAHPIMQLLAFVGLYKQALYVHNTTIPKPIGYK